MSPNVTAQSQAANKISPSNNYSDSKLDFTFPFHLIDGYIFIDGQVNGRKGKFAFFLNHHFVPLTKDKYLSEGHAASGQFIVLHTQNRVVSAGSIRQLLIKKLAELVFCSMFGIDPQETLEPDSPMAAHS